MKRLIYASVSAAEYYGDICRNGKLVATFTDDLYGKLCSVYDLGSGQFALVDDQNQEVAEIRNHLNADIAWIHRYCRHIRDYMINGRLAAIEYTPEYQISVNSSSDPYASKYSSIREATDFLNTVDPDKRALVEDCRNDIYRAYEEYCEPSEEAPFLSTESRIIRDYQSIAAEQWDELTIDEASDLFDKIFDALCVVHSDDAAAWW